MIFYPEYLKLIEGDFEEFKNYESELRSYAAIRKVELLRTDFEKRKQENYIEYVVEIICLYQDLVFFPDQEIINCFTKLGLKPGQLKWFTKLDSIKEELDKINFESLLFIFPYYSIVFINDFFGLKIKNEIIIWADLVKLFEKGKFRSKLYTGNLKKIKKRNYYSPHEVQNPDFLDDQVYFQMSTLNGITKNEEASKKFLLDNTEGNLEKYWIKGIVQYVLDIKKVIGMDISERETFLCLYELLRIILKDDNLMTHEEFKISKYGLYKSDFKRYVVLKIKKALQLGEPEIFKV